MCWVWVKMRMSVVAGGEICIFRAGLSSLVALKPALSTADVLRHCCHRMQAESKQRDTHV